MSLHTHVGPSFGAPADDMDGNIIMGEQLNQVEEKIEKVESTLRSEMQSCVSGLKSESRKSKPRC